MSQSPARKKLIRFINTYQPVSRHYPDLIPYLLAHGCEVEVIISRVTYRAGSDESWKQPGVSVRYMPSLGLKANSIVGKLGLMLLFIVSAALVLLFGRRADINLFYTQPPLFILWGVLIKRLRGTPCYEVVMDIYPYIAVELGMLKPSSPLTRIMASLRRFSMRHADGLFVIGRCMRQRVIDMGVPPERVHFVPNWSNPDAVQSLEHSENPFRGAHGWDGKFVVMFAGNIGIPQYFDDMLEACRRLRDDDRFRFVLVGDGYRRKEIAAYVQAHGLTNVEILPFLPQNQQTYFTSAADLHFVSLRRGIEGLAVPSKTYSVLAAGRAVLYQGEAEGEIARLVQEHGIGWYVPLQAPDVLEAAIRAYLAEPERARDEGRKARALALTELSAETVCRQYGQILGLE